MTDAPKPEPPATEERLLRQEEAILEATEAVCAVLNETGTEQQVVAERLGVSKSHVSQLLSGARNMTIRSLADLAFALGRKVRIDLPPPSPPRSAGRVWTLVHRSLSLGMVTEHFWNVEGEKPEKDAEPIRVVPEAELEAARTWADHLEAERDRYKKVLELADRINWLDMGDYYDATSIEAVEAFRAALADAGKGEGKND